ncbi:MAG: hypothetical protein AB2705_04340 [Candidatus Thiodiazotropha sp.]
MIPLKPGCHRAAARIDRPAIEARDDPGRMSPAISRLALNSSAQKMTNAGGSL